MYLDIKNIGNKNGSIFSDTLKREHQIVNWLARIQAKLLLQTAFMIWCAIFFLGCTKKKWAHKQERVVAISPRFMKN